jgi:lipopolysaccharide transport system permease protein
MKQDEELQDWDLVIDTETSIFELNLNDIWLYRDLLWLLVKRDFISFYKQTILGPLWFFIQPLFTTIIFTLIFGNLAGISTDGLPQPLFYMAGITAWNYFADCLTKTSTVFRDNANIFGKVYFPRLIMPLSIVVSNLVRFGVQMLLFFMMIGYYILQKEVNTSFHPNIYILLFPLLVLLMALLGLGLGLIITALTTKYRDLAFLITFGVQLLMYGTTVIYPLSAAPLEYRWLIELNPMTGIIEAFRLGFLGQGAMTLFSLVYTILFTLIVLVTGVIIFNKTEKTFVDTV